jgi:hypothetical protein
MPNDFPTSAFDPRVMTRWSDRRQADVVYVDCHSVGEVREAQPVSLGQAGVHYATWGYGILSPTEHRILSGKASAIDALLVLAAKEV